MTKVEHLNELGETVAPFSGKTSTDALKDAEEWAVRNHVALGHYYVQISGRSIIADYTKKAEEE